MRPSLASHHLRINVESPVPQRSERPGWFLAGTDLPDLSRAYLKPNKVDTHVCTSVWRVLLAICLRILHRTGVGRGVQH